MFKDDYRKELDNITASEKFKNDTISLMYAKQSEPAKTVRFAKYFIIFLDYFYWQYTNNQYLHRL